MLINVAEAHVWSSAGLLKAAGGKSTLSMSDQAASAQHEYHAPSAKQDAQAPSMSDAIEHWLPEGFQADKTDNLQIHFHKFAPSQVQLSC